MWIIDILRFTLAVITGCSLKEPELQRTGRLAHMGCHGNHLPLCCAAAEHNFALKGCSLRHWMNSNIPPSFLFLFFIPFPSNISSSHLFSWGQRAASSMDHL